MQSDPAHMMRSLAGAWPLGLFTLPPMFQLADHLVDEPRDAAFLAAAALDYEHVRDGLRKAGLAGMRLPMHSTGSSNSMPSFSA